MPPGVTIWGWVTATVAMAFIGCTDIGMRKWSPVAPPAPSQARPLAGRAVDRDVADEERDQSAEVTESPGQL